MDVNPSALTLQEVMRYALPLDVTIITGADQLERPIHWVVTVDAHGGIPYLEGQELVIVAPSKDDLTDLVNQYAQAGIAVLATTSPLSPITIAAANAHHLPLLQLPAMCNYRELERNVIELILGRKDKLERRSTQIYQELVQLVSENIGLEKLIHEICRHTGKAVVLQDKHLRIQQYAVTPALAEDWDELTDLLTDRRMLPVALQDRHRLPRHATNTVRQTLRDDGLIRLTEPIVTQSIGRGYLSFIGREENFDEVDELVIRHAAVVCALEMARAKSISEMEKKLRGDFLDSLMISTVGEAEALAEGDRFGHDMSAPHIALVMYWYGNKHPTSRRLETLVNGMISGQRIQALTRLRDNELRLFYAVDSTNPIQMARELAEGIHAEARREYPDAKLTIGIGSLANRVNDWRSSYWEASQAADIGRRLQADQPTFSGDLGIYTFLSRAEILEELRGLRDSTIGNLIQYEERQKADLLQTLEAFFACHGNHTQTAEMLSVHRNTLFYRMNRIAEITGLDLNRPDVRLAVHLALKVHRLLTSDN